jgi:hypothetical protein
MDSKPEARFNGPEPVIEVTLGARAYTLRPSHDALMRIEDRLGCTLSMLRARMLGKDYGIRMVTTILDAGIRADLENEAPAFEEIAAHVARQGVEDVLPAAIDLVLAGCVGLEMLAGVQNRQAAEDAAAGDVAGPPEPQG